MELDHIGEIPVSAQRKSSGSARDSPGRIKEPGGNPPRAASGISRIQTSQGLADPALSPRASSRDGLTPSVDRGAGYELTTVAELLDEGDAREQVIAVVGAPLILVAYAGNQRGLIGRTRPAHRWLNLVGSLILTVVA
jgi:hypothetical protein